MQVVHQVIHFLLSVAPLSWPRGYGLAYDCSYLTGAKRYNRIQDNAMPLTEGIDVLKWDNQVCLWSRAAVLMMVAVCPVLAVLSCNLLVRIVLVTHMALVVLGMLMDPM